MSRRMGVGAVTLLALVCLPLLARPAAFAKVQLPVGEAEGVRAFRDRQGAIAIVFTPRAARLYRRVAGRTITVECTEMPEEVGLGGSGWGSGSQNFRVRRNRHRFATGDVTPGTDYCRVWLARRWVGRGPARHREERELIVSIPLTQSGAIFLDEQLLAFELDSAVSIIGNHADEVGSRVWPTFEQLKAGRETARLVRR